MAKKGRGREKRDLIIKTVSLAAVILLTLVSAYQNGGLEGLSRIKDDIARELWSDGAVPAGRADIDYVPDGNILRVHFIDVGQGKSILIEAPEKTALIDAGENNKGEIVLRYLDRQRINGVDIAIGTHPHSDHIGGLDTVIHAVPVEKVVLPVIPEEMSPTSPTYVDLLNEIAEKNLKITPAKPGDAYDLGGGAALKILAPVHDDYTDLNDFSVVSRLDFGATSFLFTGDATSEVERDLLESGAKLRANVLDVGHHGSRGSTSSDFLHAVRPAAAVISCGTDNSYGHPHRQTVTRLEAVQGIKILRTDLDGSVIISSDGKELSYETVK